MKINLTDTSIFDGEITRFKDAEISLDKPINFIFGKNGTCKSSLCKLIEKQCSPDKHKVYIFQGLESVISEDEKLDAIVLGEENAAIDKQIKAHEAKRDEVQSDINKENSKISEPENGEENLCTQKQALEKEKEYKEREEDRFYTGSAGKISAMKDPALVENSRTYNKNLFSGEIETALRQPKLSDNEAEKLKETIKVDPKPVVNEIHLDEIDFTALQNKVKELLQKTVQSAEVIPELENNPTKQQFAQSGKSCRKAGDTCAFCGNTITKERLQKLERYFSGSAIDGLNSELTEQLDKIQTYNNSLSEIDAKKEWFYPEFGQQASECVRNINDVVREQQGFLKHCKDSLGEKQKDLFNAVAYNPIELPPELAEYINEYNGIARENNQYTQQLAQKKKEARDKLRLDKVAEIVRQSNLATIRDEIKRAETLLGEKEKEINEVIGAIEKLDNDKTKEQKAINDLIAKTKSTKKLAERINKKLEAHVNFQLCRKEADNREFYEIKETFKDEERIRSVSELSTGEKNIIAFLYFIESLSDAERDHTKPKVIVFDDPMNSNDDTMQYLIVDEIEKIIKMVNKPQVNDIFILLTHNVSFYLNSTRLIKTECARRNTKPYEEYNFYRFMACNGSAEIQRLDKEAKDFRNQYESLWYELYFLYNNKKADLMCNPIRRIIESYVSFTRKDDFYKDNKDAKNLFNANSHSIIDPTTDIVGKTHDDIKNILQRCFENNSAKEHFDAFWKLAKNANST